MYNTQVQSFIPTHQYITIAIAYPSHFSTYWIFNLRCRNPAGKKADKEQIDNKLAKKNYTYSDNQSD